jgi:hypothetical protein
MLCNSLPLPYDYSGLLCETLFAQLLRLPTSRLSPLAFSGLIAHAALLRPAFPKYLAGSVRQLFLRVEFLAPELVLRLAEVLAHFITNMGFRCAAAWDGRRTEVECWLVLCHGSDHTRQASSVYSLASLAPTAVRV